MMHASAIILVTASVLAGFTQAQNSTYPYAVDPGTVSMANRFSWCNDQRTSCGQLCAGNAPDNKCDPTSLVWSCTCGNGNKPNITAYNNTVPWNECQNAYKPQCLQRNPTDAMAQQSCNAIQCGGMDPAKAAVSTSASSSSSSAMTTSASQSASNAATSAAATHNAAPLMTKIDAAWGTVALAVSAGFLFGSIAL